MVLGGGTKTTQGEGAANPDEALPAKCMKTNGFEDVMSENDDKQMIILPLSKAQELQQETRDGDIH